MRVLFYNLSMTILKLKIIIHTKFIPLFRSKTSELSFHAHTTPKPHLYSYFELQLLNNNEKYPIYSSILSDTVLKLNLCTHYTASLATNNTLSVVFLCGH